MIPNGKPATGVENSSDKPVSAKIRSALQHVRGFHVVIVAVLASLVIGYISVAPPTDLPNWPLYRVNARTWQFFERWGQQVKPHHTRVMTMALQHLESRCLYIISYLEVPDILQENDKPMSCEEIKKAVDIRQGYNPVHVQYFCRILHAAAHFDLLEEKGEDSYTLTPLSNYLTSNHPKSLKNYVKLFSGDEAMVISTALSRSIFSGQSGFSEIYRQELLKYMKVDPQLQQIYDSGIADSARLHAPAIIADYPPFTSCKHICDIGGGVGSFLSALLEYYPRGIKGTNFDLPEVIENAKQFLATKKGIPITLVAGNFSEPLPKMNCDCYILKDILENWSDEDASVILNNLREIIGSGNRLLVIERTLHTGSHSEEKFKVLMDLTMMAFNPSHSRLRSEEELGFLLAQARFSEPTMLPTRAGYTILESYPTK